MEYEIDVLDGGGSRIAIMSGLVRASLKETVNGVSVLTAETVEEKDWARAEAGSGFLRLRERDGVSSTYRIIGARIERAGERISASITARGILADTMTEIFAGARDCIGMTPAEAMNTVLAHSRFGAGTVEPEGVIPWVRFEYEPVWDCLLRICSLTGGELALDEASGVIGLLARAGSDMGASLRYGLNLKGASRTVDTSRLANRVYGVGGGEPPLTVTGATESGGECYAEDSESVERYGLHEASLHEPTLEDVTNLVATPSLDGVYTGGLCENWTNDGASVSRCTDPLRCLYGSVSQRVETALDGQGVWQDVTVTPGRVYSLLANVFVAAGAVRVSVADGTSCYRRAEPVTGTGFATVRIENWKANNGTVRVSARQEGAGGADFSVDSVQIAEGAGVRPFTVGANADALWRRTAGYLASHKEPDISYEVDIAEDGFVGGGGVSAPGRIRLGDTVRVTDHTLGMDVATRVMEREAELVRPRRVSVRLDNAARTLADVFDAIRKAQEEGVRRMRAALTESSRAAEAGSSRLGFSRVGCRFSGAVTSSGWNAVNWSAGTLRVGDAYYAIEAGSFTGLGAGSVFHASFDRTDPQTFTLVSSAEEAEGEDRTAVFAITTTSSPEPCVIHPPGLIAG